MKTSANDNYILDTMYHHLIINQNISTDCWLETRIENVYTIDIWNKLSHLQMTERDFQNKVIMDICWGSWFLTYHLLQKDIKPKKIVVCDISWYELEQAKKLLDPIKWNIHIEYLCKNIWENKLPSESFDIIIGNSFLHHFYDLPVFLQSIWRILKPGGYFLGTHEPTIYAVAIESGCFLFYIYSLIRWSAYIDDIRYKGNTIKPNNLWDVRVFDYQKLYNTFHSVWFKNIIIKHWNIFKSFLTTNLWLSPIKIPISKRTRLYLMKIGIKIDSFLNRILSDRFFWDIVFKVQK